ncbi:MAG TPA: CopG family antitoxin [Bdellovibrionota bacterium]|nr:CopG family antitoxin [Bdellovibrionota bacterium]
MSFKVTKADDRPSLKLVNFRLPETLMEELKEIAGKEEITVTDLVKQMLHYCIEEYKKKK